jgi:hypothetical protein
MNAPSPLSETTVSPGLRSSEGTRLHGSWLVLARVVWVALIVFTVGIFVVSLPVYFAQLQTVCVGDLCVYRYGQLTPGTAKALQDVGFSIGGYAASILALAIALALVSFGVAGVIFWRRSDNWMAMLVSLFLVTFGANFIAPGLLAANLQTAWYLPLTILTLLGLLSLNLLLYLFPDGQFVPHWTRPLAVFMVGINIFLDAYPDAFSRLSPWVISAIFLGLGGTGVVAQIYRYVRVSGPVQRQQTKWVVFGLAATMLVVLSRYVPILIFPSLSTSSSLYLLVSAYVYPLGLLLIPVTLGIAALRYRLWDIDIIINRTLVYGLLTVILTAVYVGLVIGLQGLLRGIISQDNSVAIVISTLAIAALFQPLRHRLQKIIDRRFYRSKYDAAKIIEAFSATLRNEVDLTTLSEQLAAVVQETMKPSHISLWLRQPEQSRERDTRRPPRSDEEERPAP